MNSVSEVTKIPLYGLYGELLSNTEPGFVHIESIAERSRGEGWSIKPHRHHNLVQLLLIETGSAEIILDNDRVSLNEQGIILIPAEVIHGFDFQPQTEGAVLSIALPIFNEILDAIKDEINISHFNHASVLDLRSTANQFQLANQIKQTIQNEFSRQKKYSHGFLKHLMSALFILYARAFDIQTVRLKQSSHSNHLQNFIALLEANFYQHYPVDWYAEQANLSVSTLNRICKATLNKSAKKLIDERVLLEAKRRLIYTLNSVENIAFALGFDDPAYFSRFFAKYEKMPPGRYRKNNSQTTHS